MVRKKRPIPEEIVLTIINKMFEIAGHDVTYEQVARRKDAWFQEWTMTYEQNREWTKWMTEYFKKERKMSAKIAEREAKMCAFMWGLKFSDSENRR